MTGYLETPANRFRQGDILRDVEIVTWVEPIGGELTVTTEQLPYCIVLTQECDLEQDFSNQNDPQKLQRSQDKFLPFILLCPAYPAEQLKGGSHLASKGLAMQVIGKSDWKRIEQNNNYRYHFLTENEAHQVPSLVIDFKHYVTVPRNIAYRENFKNTWLVSLADLFREHLSNRFAHYLSRIGLPEPDEQSV